MLDRKTDEWEIMFKRLEDVAKTTFGSLSAMAVNMGRHPATFSSYKSQKKQVGMKMLIDLKNKFNINTDYILYGDKPIFLQDKAFGHDEKLAVLPKNILRYVEIHKSDTDEHVWEKMLFENGISDKEKTIYKVIDGETLYYYSDRQFNKKYKILQS
jgi:hypothetical protein